jgi:type II pantothenate kinase
MIVVSMGTGTSLVKCDGKEIKHIGGIGIGGGTLAGLSRIMLKLLRYVASNLYSTKCHCLLHRSYPTD